MNVPESRRTRGHSSWGTVPTLTAVDPAAGCHQRDVCQRPAVSMFLSYELRTGGGRACFSTAGPGCPSPLRTSADGRPGQVDVPPRGLGAALPLNPVAVGSRLSWTVYPVWLGASCGRAGVTESPLLGTLGHMQSPQRATQNILGGCRKGDCGSGHRALPQLRRLEVGSASS